MLSQIPYGISVPAVRAQVVYCARSRTGAPADVALVEQEGVTRLARELQVGFQGFFCYKFRVGLQHLSP